MILPFTKMHGCGNDFVVLDARDGADVTPAMAAALADRRRGVGCDQVLILEPSPSHADVFMRVRNPDGSEAGACGNGTRCVAALLGGAPTIETVAGLLPSERLADGTLRVDMGPARLGWADVPLDGPADTLHLDLALGEVADPAACSMGNPHATFFVADVAALDVMTLGCKLEVAPIFPDRANIGFAQVFAPDVLRVRFWERGAGNTASCGSGACAAAVNAARRGLTGRHVIVRTDGGDLAITWRADGHVLMAGPTAVTFTGMVNLGALAA